MPRSPRNRRTNGHPQQTARYLMRNRGFTSLAIIATVTVLALAAVAVQVLPTRASTADPASATRRRDRRRPAGSSGHLDELRFDAVRSARSQRHARFALGDPTVRSRHGPFQFPNDVTGRKLWRGSRWLSIRPTDACRSCPGRRSGGTTRWLILPTRNTDDLGAVHHARRPGRDIPTG